MASTVFWEIGLRGRFQYSIYNNCTRRKGTAESFFSHFQIPIRGSGQNSTRFSGPTLGAETVGLIPESRFFYPERATPWESSEACTACTSGYSYVSPSKLRITIRSLFRESI